MLKNLNESFDKKYFIEADITSDVDGKPQYIRDMEKQLHELAISKMSQGITNIKDYEYGFQSVIESFFPDYSWWEITDCNIFWTLFETKDVDETVDRIIEGIKPEFLKDDVIEKAESRKTNIEAEKAINDHEAEYGADGYRVFRDVERLDKNESLEEDVIQFNADSFEKCIPSKMRFKQYDKVNGNDLYWITQEFFDEDDVKKFAEAFKNIGFDKAYVTVRDLSSYDFDEDLTRNVFVVINKDGSYDMSDYVSYRAKRFNTNESLSEALGDIESVSWSDKIKDVYKDWYPDDELGNEMDGSVTFEDAYNALHAAMNNNDNEFDFYDLIGVGDSIIRERIFNILADLKDVDYDYIFYMWLGNKDKLRKLMKNESLKESALEDGDEPYTYKEMWDVLKDNGILDKEKGSFSVMFREEAEHCKKILSRAGYKFEVSGDDRTVPQWFRFDYWKGEKKPALYNNVKEQMAFIKSLTNNVESLINRADDDIKSELEKAFDAVRYTDPMSVDGVKDIEEEISNEFNNLKSAVKSEDLESVKKSVREFIALIKDRANKVKLLKEDTVKQGNYWVNKGKEGTHGKFRTKKQADAQRKAMFAQGYQEKLGESLIETDQDFRLFQKEVQDDAYDEDVLLDFLAGVVDELGTEYDGLLIEPSGVGASVAIYASYTGRDGNPFQDNTVYTTSWMEPRELDAALDIIEDSNSRKTAVERMKNWYRHRLNKATPAKSVNESIKNEVFADNYFTGTVIVGDNRYYYEAKVFERPSQFGIDGGNISKLYVKCLDDGRVVAHYDRGWDMEPADTDTKKVVKIIEKRFSTVGDLVEGFSESAADKYYNRISEKEFAETLGFDSVEEFRENDYIDEAAESYNVKRVAFLKAKPEYFDKLDNDGYAFVDLVSDGKKEFVGFYAGGRLYDIEDEIEQIVEE